MNIQKDSFANSSGSQACGEQAFGVDNPPSAGNPAGIPHSAIRISNRAVELIAKDENPFLKRKEDKSNKFVGLHPAHRRIIGKKKHKRIQREYQPVRSVIYRTDAPLDEPVFEGYSESIPFNSEVEERLEQLDNEFLEMCAKKRLEREQSDQFDSYFNEFYSVCEITEEPSVDAYDIPLEYSTDLSPSESGSVVCELGFVECQRREFDVARKEAEILKKENLSRKAASSISSASTVVENSFCPPIPSQDDEKKQRNVNSFLKRQSDSKDFRGFPKIDDSLSPDFERLMSQKVHIPTGKRLIRKRTLDVRSAKSLCSREKRQNGSVIFCPQGSGKTTAASRFPSILDSSLLPIPFRNKEALRNIADSGNIVITNRLRDCDERTIYLLPDDDRYFANIYVRSLKSPPDIWSELDYLKTLKAVKFKLSAGQYLMDFLRYRMCVYRCA